MITVISSFLLLFTALQQYFKVRYCFYFCFSTDLSSISGPSQVLLYVYAKCLVSHPFSQTYTCNKWGQIIYLTPSFFSLSREIKKLCRVCAITICSNKLLFPVKNSPEITCCWLKIMHPDSIASFNGSHHIFTRYNKLLM